MRYHFGIGFALELVSLLNETFLQGKVVLDDAIVHDRDSLTTGRLRVGVLVRDTAVGRPSRVRHPDVSLQSRQVTLQLNVLYAACAFSDLKPAGTDRGHPGGVIPSILDSSQPLKEEVRDWLLRNASDYAAHAIA
jgi:hypothetical protein